MDKDLERFIKYVKIDTQSSEDENKTYDMYYEYEEIVKYIKTHRKLALNRGENEGVLSVSIEYDKERVLGFLEKRLIKK